MAIRALRLRPRSSSGSVIQPTMLSLGRLAAHVETLNDFTGGRYWVDLTKSSRAWASTFGDFSNVSVDTNGWPTVASSNVYSSGTYESGTSYTGGSSAQLDVGDVCKLRVDKAVTTVTPTGCTLTNQTSDATFNYWDLTVTNAGIVGLTFNAGMPNGSRLMRPGFTITDNTYWNPGSITYHKQFSGMRFMKLFNTEVGPPFASWATRPLLANNKNSATSGMIWEDAIDLCNTLYSASGSNFKKAWFNFSHLNNTYPSTTDTWVGAATLVKSSLNPSIVTEFEQSNEIWNTNYTAQAYYFNLGKTLTNSLYNNIDGGTQDFTSVTRGSGLVTTTVTVVTAAAHGLTTGQAMSFNVPSVPGYNCTNSTSTIVINATTFTYVCAVAGNDSLVMAGAPATGDNIIMCRSPGVNNLDYDFATDFTKYRNRAYAQDVRRMAIAIESVYGAGSLNNTVRIVIATQAVQPTYLQDMLKYLTAVYTDRLPSAYIYTAAFAPYAQPVGSTPTALLAAIDTETAAYVLQAKSWMQICSVYGVKASLYEWGIDWTRGSPGYTTGNTVSVANMNILQNNPALIPKIQTLGQDMIDLGVEDMYYHIVTPLLEPGHGFNICQSFSNVTSPKLLGMQALGSVTPKQITAFNLMPSVASPSPVANSTLVGGANGPGSVYQIDSFGTSAGGGSTQWSNQINSSFYGIQGGTIAQKRWFEMEILAPDAGNFTFNLLGVQNGAVSRNWTIEIDGVGITFPMAPTAGGGNYTSLTYAYQASDTAPVTLSAGYHKVKVYTDTIIPADQCGCNAIRVTKV